ncbi:MAG: hypothetical protein ICV80_11645 [Microcoleus sp. T1-bin1]|nr:hypothetical protein [Microcoleus sp. T1-bin1]
MRQGAVNRDLMDLTDWMLREEVRGSREDSPHLPLSPSATLPICHSPHLPLSGSDTLPISPSDSFFWDTLLTVGDRLKLDCLPQFHLFSVRVESV